MFGIPTDPLWKINAHNQWIKKISQKPETKHSLHRDKCPEHLLHFVWAHFIGWALSTSPFSTLVIPSITKTFQIYFAKGIRISFNSNKSQLNISREKKTNLFKVTSKATSEQPWKPSTFHYPDWFIVILISAHNKSPYNWVGFHPLHQTTNQGPW